MKTFKAAISEIPPLSKGSHFMREDGICAMEAVAWLAGEPHSAHPVCVSPTIGRCVRRWNDALPDADRDRLLRPLLLVMLGTVTTPEDERTRAHLALDWLVRVHVPAFLSLTPALVQHAHALRALPEINLGREQLAVRDALKEARHASWGAITPADWRVTRVAAEASVAAAAGTAAEIAAKDAALHGCENIARDTAEVAAVAAAGNAAWSAAGARAAGWAAALDAALDATMADLQTSAQDLVRRMASVGAGVAHGLSRPAGIQEGGPMNSTEQKQSQ